MLEDRAASSGQHVMSRAGQPRYEWNALPWPELEGKVFKLQKRIYRASSRGDVRLAHSLQRLLVKSTSAKLLAVRRVTQDNSGKRTAGVDGKLALAPKERVELASTLDHRGKSLPVRRVWIPKPGKEEQRPLGIPVIRDRARQALVKLALEPEWEARFEPNSFGFRPGRSCHDAIEAIFDVTKNKTAYVLDADIAGCFDNIDHAALLAKLRTMPAFRRVIRGWLRAGVLDGNVFQETDRGTPQGGVISPLLANIALHGLETDTRAALLPELRRVEKEKRGASGLNPGVYRVIRYADDFVVVHHNREIVLRARGVIGDWLKGIGLELKPSKTRLCHTMERLEEEPPGFDFLGFHVQQVAARDRRQGFKLLIRPSRKAVKRHLLSIREELRRLRGAPQEAVIRKLNPIVKGWSRYYCTAISRKVFERCGHLMHQKLWRWARFRHPHKGERWVKRKYFRSHGGDDWRFMTHDGQFLMRHQDHRIQRHTRVRGDKSPYDGDWVYWAMRRGKYPGISPRAALLIKGQQGRCGHCRRPIGAEDLIEVHHIDGNRQNNARANLALVHRHCHDTIHGTGADDRRRHAEEPDELKSSRPVLEPGEGERSPSPR